MTTIWHYTSGPHLEKILSSGKLKVFEAERRMGVKPPALWLSASPILENTANKMVNENGKVRLLTKEEQHNQFGLIRISVAFDSVNFILWAKYKFRTNTSLDQAPLDGADRTKSRSRFPRTCMLPLRAFQKVDSLPSRNGSKWINSR